MTRLRSQERPYRGMIGKVALVQSAVILAGILAANVGYQMASGIVGFAPDSTAFLAHFGLLLLALPFAWFIAAVRLWNRPLPKRLALGSGIALIIGLTLFSAFAVGKPWVGSAQWLQPG